MINSVVIVGRLTADPEMRSAESGTSVATFTVAVDRDFKKGEEKQADFIKCVSFKETAEFITKYFYKGNKIGIQGKLQSRSYLDKQGTKRTVTEVLVNKAYFMESATRTETSMVPAQGSGMEALPDPDDDLPF